jgi:hypothetical protein
MSTLITAHHKFAVLLMPGTHHTMLVPSEESIPILNPDAYLNHVPPIEGAAIEFKNEIGLFILRVIDYEFFCAIPSILRRRFPTRHLQCVDVLASESSASRQLAFQLLVAF